MSFCAMRHEHFHKLLVVGILCVVAFPGANAHEQDTKKMIVTPFQNARFAPVDPAKPDGAKMAVLWGDPAKGPSAILLKFKKGSHPFHIHTSDYHLVVVQ